MFKQNLAGRSTLLLAAFLFVHAGFSQTHARSSDWRVCLYNFADVNEPTLGSMQVELAELFHPSRLILDQAPCPAGSEPVVYLILREDGPSNEHRTLGRAPKAKGQILPILEVYVEPLVGMIGQGRSSLKLGRALARVTAHEITHYIRQDPRHFRYGLMRSGFTGRELAEEDSHPFLRR